MGRSRNQSTTWQALLVPWEMGVINITSRHRHLNISLELLWVVSEDSRSFMIQGVFIIRLLRTTLGRWLVTKCMRKQNANSQLLHIQSKMVLTEKRRFKPYIMVLIFKTGFQSSRRMFRQTFPSRSILG